MAVLNTILWGNYSGDADIERQQIWPGAGDLTVDHTCIEGWSGDLGGPDSHGLDPLFVFGPAGCDYLSQTAAGQTSDSPCVDTGSGTAAELGLSALTTRTDENPDTGDVDMGYHYPMTGHGLVMGDSDHDGQVTREDYADFPGCFTGEGAADLSRCCGIFDFDADDDVDLRDFAEFQTAFMGP